MVDRQAFIGQIRDYLRDHPQFNSLLHDFETSDGIISICADLAADDFSTTAPFISRHTVETMPSLYLLHLGTIIQILRSAGLLQARNNLNYSDGGLTVATSDKSPIYKAWADSLFIEYEQKKKNLKMQLNARGAWGGCPSEYSYLGAWGQYAGLVAGDAYTSYRHGVFVF